jgi:hypothetical protein
MSEANTPSSIESEKNKLAEFLNAEKHLRQSILKIHNNPELSATEKARKIQVLDLTGF